MNVTPRVKVDFVQYRGSDFVLVNVILQLINDEGDVVASNPTENVRLSQEDLTARAEANGHKTWGDREVEDAIGAAYITNIVPDMDSEEEGATKEVRIPRFAGIPIVW